MRKILIFGTAASLLFACGPSTDERRTPAVDSVMKENNTETTIDSAPQRLEADTASMQKGTVKLTPLKDSPEFPDAKIEANAPEEDAKLKAGDIKFEYEVKNYQLKHQTTEGTCSKVCANSDKGQHIHLILNNQPYIAIYEPNYSQNLKDGHYVALSFLSRSYHESIKTRDAYDLRQFTVGNTKQEKVDLTKPMLFYSRPKGEYVGDEINKVLLDFYLINTDLSANGNKVRATINGNEFILPSWQPYLIEGLPIGESTIKLELVDENGKLVESPYNSIERKITLKESKAS